VIAILVGCGADGSVVIEPVGLVADVIVAAREAVGRRLHARHGRELLLLAVIVVGELGTRFVTDTRHEGAVLDERAIRREIGVVDRVANPRDRRMRSKFSISESPGARGVSKLVEVILVRAVGEDDVRGTIECERIHLMSRSRRRCTVSIGTRLLLRRNVVPARAHLTALRHEVDLDLHRGDAWLRARARIAWYSRSYSARRCRR